MVDGWHTCTPLLKPPICFSTHFANFTHRHMTFHPRVEKWKLGHDTDRLLMDYIIPTKIVPNGGRMAYLHPSAQTANLFLHPFCQFQSQTSWLLLRVSWPVLMVSGLLLRVSMQILMVSGQLLRVSWLLLRVSWPVLMVSGLLLRVSMQILMVSGQLLRVRTTDHQDLHTNPQEQTPDHQDWPTDPQ